MEEHDLRENSIMFALLITDKAYPEVKTDTFLAIFVRMRLNA